jgi:hypothetical protein
MAVANTKEVHIVVPKDRADIRSNQQRLLISYEVVDIRIVVFTKCTMHLLDSLRGNESSCCANLAILLKRRERVLASLPSISG